jgi:DNA mismatch endonuclease (patch repair protein)
MAFIGWKIRAKRFECEGVLLDSKQPCPARAFQSETKTATAGKDIDKASWPLSFVHSSRVLFLILDSHIKVLESFMAKFSEKGQVTGRQRRIKRRTLVQGRGPSSKTTVSAARSRIMRSIKQKDTKPEISVRKIIHALGFRFRLHQRTLPGRPDIVMKRHRVIVQVHGCFWHQHGCSISNVPRTRKEYWLPKLARNVERDSANRSLLANMGWRVVTVWECDLRDIPALSNKLYRFIKG